MMHMQKEHNMRNEESNEMKSSDYKLMRFVCSVFFFIAILLLSFRSLSVAADAVPDFFVPPPPFSEDIFPCSECHADMEVNETRRELDFHEDIVLKNHAEEQRWCLDCHNPTDRDKLRLASGQLILFEKSYLLCGQCHGTIFRDWKAGVHGKRTGYWNGKKQYRLCVHCHDPHQPKFKPLQPLPPPDRPDEIKPTKSTTVKVPRNPLERMLESESDHAKEN
jgi:hypothetical protein